MELIEDFYTTVTIGQQYNDYLLSHGYERFNKWLPENCDKNWYRVLSKFVLSAPLTYWDAEIVEKALEFLEKNTTRTIAAIVYKTLEIDNGVDNLLRTSKKPKFEELIDLDKASEILLLSNEIHPDYLFMVEHIFGNLIELYWAVLKKKGVQGIFDLPSAVDILHNLGADVLVGGYDDKIRNAIAHGQVLFRGIDIQYGSHLHKYELAPFEFFDKYDLLWRTSVSLTIGLLLFLSRNANFVNEIPLSIKRLFASVVTERDDFLIQDYMISELNGNGRQLHVLVSTSNYSMNSIIKDCVHFAIQLYRLTEESFSRILFDIDYDKKTLSGLLIIDFQKLIELIKTSAPLDRTKEFIVSNLLWYDEDIKKFIRRNFMKNLQTASAYGYRRAFILNEKRLPWLPIDIYRVKKVKKTSAGGVPKIEITAVLVNPIDADNFMLTRRVCKHLINMYKSIWIETNPSKLGKYKNIYLPPQNIQIFLYKNDGTVRWLNFAGRARNDLVYIAEFSRNMKKRFVVKQPDFIEGKIHYKILLKPQKWEE